MYSHSTHRSTRVRSRNAYHTTIYNMMTFCTLQLVVKIRSPLLAATQATSTFVCNVGGLPERNEDRDGRRNICAASPAQSSKAAVTPTADASPSTLCTITLV